MWCIFSAAPLLLVYKVSETRFLMNSSAFIYQRKHDISKNLPLIEGQEAI